MPECVVHDKQRKKLLPRKGGPGDSDRAGMQSLKFFLKKAMKAKRISSCPFPHTLPPLHCSRPGGLAQTPLAGPHVCAWGRKKRLILFALICS